MDERMQGGGWARCEGPAQDSQAAGSGNCQHTGFLELWAW